MTYTVGDEIDQYVLTAQGWVPRLDLDPSPHRPGAVVNGAILTADLLWQPLRMEPKAPYVIGDVVEGYVLAPSGDWIPLTADQLPVHHAAKSQYPGPRPTTKPRKTESTAVMPAVLHEPVPEPRYKVGDVVNGMVFTRDRGWVALNDVMTPRQVTSRPVAPYQPGRQQPRGYSGGRSILTGQARPGSQTARPRPSIPGGREVGKRLANNWLGWLIGVIIVANAFRSCGN